MRILRNLNFSALKFNEDTSFLVEEICRPLFKYFGLTNFGYVKIDKEGKMLRISTGLEWTKRYFEACYYNDIDFYFFHDVPLNSSISRIYTNKPLGGVYSELYDHNIWNIYTVYEKDIDFCHVYFFATSRENTGVIDFYINEKVVLDAFTTYFKKQTALLLNMDNSENLIKTNLHIQQVKVREKEQNAQQFLTDIGCYINKKNDALTNKEKECAKFLINGCSAKEVARLLNISNRTVEFHLSNIKTKLGCRNKAQLIKTLLEY